MRKRQADWERDREGRERPGETTWQEVLSDIDVGRDDGTLGSSEDERWRKTLHNQS